LLLGEIFRCCRMFLKLSESEDWDLKGLEWRCVFEALLSRAQVHTS